MLRHYLESEDGVTYEIRGKEPSIGRKKTQDVTFPSVEHIKKINEKHGYNEKAKEEIMSVSRTHGRFVLSDELGESLIKDENSKWGIRHNGERIKTPKGLNEKDILEFGLVKVTYHEKLIK